LSDNRTGSSADGPRSRTGQLCLPSQQGGHAVFEQFGGNASVVHGSGWLVIGWGSGHAVLNLFDGQMTSPPSGNDTTLNYTASMQSFNMINLLGSNVVFDTAVSANSTRALKLASTSGNLGAVVNLNAGTLIANRIYAGSSGTPSRFGFNGGTLQANASGTLLQSGLTAATVYSGGAKVEVPGNITAQVTQALTPPYGYGLKSVGLTSGGSAYIGAPVVIIGSDHGSGATAIATVDLTDGSPTRGQVNGFTVTSPGSGYHPGDTSLVVSLVGGGCAAPAVPGTCTLALNDTQGGLLKTGAGMLMLSGINTYGGATTISNGTLRLGAPHGVPPDGMVHVVNGGIYDLGMQDATNGTVNLVNGTLQSGTLRARLQKTGGSVANVYSTRVVSGVPIVVESGTLRLGGRGDLGLFEGRLGSVFDITTPNP